jgi:hypothetical protein
MGKLVEERPLKKSRLRGKNNIKMDLRNICVCCEDGRWVDYLKITPSGCVGHARFDVTVLTESISAVSETQD